MIKPVFHIAQQEVSADEYLQTALVMEVSPLTFSYIILHPARQEVLAANHYTFPEMDAGKQLDTLRDIVNQDALLQHNFRHTQVAYNYPESTLVPESLFHLESIRDISELMFGNVQKGLILSERIPEYSIYNLYRIPAQLHNIFQSKFTAGRYWHFYSLWLQSLKVFNSEQSAVMNVLFYSDKMVLALFRNQQLQLVQTFAYQFPEDVAYHLLNTCAQFDMPADQLALHIAGYIQEDSALFEEIRKYFLHTYWDELPSGLASINLQPYPNHFFSSLLKMALCE